MVRPGRVAAIAVGLCLAWVLMAGWLVCYMNHRLDLFVWPFTIWFEIAAWWHSYSALQRFWVVLSGISPVPFLAGVAFRLGGWRGTFRPPRLRQTLFGDSKWANQTEAHSHGIVSRRTAFD